MLLNAGLKGEIKLFDRSLPRKKKTAIRTPGQSHIVPKIKNNDVSGAIRNVFCNVKQENSRLQSKY